MGRQIIKQPNGKYAIFSSIVDDFVFANATAKEMIDFCVEEEASKIRESIKHIIDMLDKNEKPYHQFTMNWEEALDTIKEVHGEEGLKDTLEAINNENH